MSANEVGMSDVDEREHTGAAGIQVVARAAAIMRALKSRPDGLTLSQLAQRVDLPRSTVQRIVGALLAEELLTPASLSSGVRLGPEITALAGAVQPGILDLARPYLTELRDATGETVDLAEFRGSHLLFIDQHLGGHRLCAVSGVGRTFPLHNSANGKACLALLAPVEARKAAIKSLGSAEPAPLERLMSEVRDVRANGIAYDWEENAPGISAVGIAFRSRTARIYAIAVPTPADRFSTTHADIGRHLLATREKLLEALGPTGEAHSQ